MNLFWQQQKKLFSYNTKDMRYHPMIMRFYLSPASKSKSAYEELRNSNILVYQVAERWTANMLLHRKLVFENK